MATETTAVLPMTDDEERSGAVNQVPSGMSRQLAVTGGSSNFGELAVFSRGQRERVPMQSQLLSAWERRPLQDHPRLADLQKPADDQLAGGQSMLRGSSSGGARELQDSRRYMLFRCTIDSSPALCLSPQWLIDTVRYSSTPAPAETSFSFARFKHEGNKYRCLVFISNPPEDNIQPTSVLCPPPSAILPRPIHKSSSLLSRETLPPLKPQTSAALERAYGISPHASHTPAIPNASSSQANISSYQPQQQQHRESCHRITPQPDENSSDGRGSVVSNGIDEAERPTHAVGFQGRWSLLCSASRCAAVATSRTYNAKSIFDLIKNVGGKFPCPHCNKVYKRKSNLKLHLLRPLSQNHGLNHSNGPDIMPADGTVQSDGMMPVPDRSSNHTHHRRQSSPSIRPDELDDGGHHDGRHSTDSAIDTSGQLCKMQKYDMPPVQYEMLSKDGPDVDQQSGLDEIPFCYTSVQQAYKIRIRLPPIGVGSIRGPSGQLDHSDSLFFAIWKVSAAALLYILVVLNSASQHHKEATEKYIQYLEHFDVSTGISSLPHTAPEQPHLLCDSAMEVHPEAQS
ncbi:hypothetical protein CABS01_16804 [Colletotrichum abscissum]|uniref:uncharacterized protein n=1 Tax=Colletotrichum abscissum TaxID=1671311 RepID=UPI0027D4ECDB|nr:uncharacterized protein CABS01_16804 [Colletotrichum abscissum]KAK1512248.1 hypothetical protein CABS01_16804 [Colletotrichum abscissum]